MSAIGCVQAAGGQLEGEVEQRQRRRITTTVHHLLMAYCTTHSAQTFMAATAATAAAAANSRQPMSIKCCRKHTALCQQVLLPLCG